MKKTILLITLVSVILGHSCTTKPAITDPAPEEVLLWADEFEGNTLDTTKWTYETGAHGWGNNEWQNYTAGQNVTVSNGILSIVARKEGPGQKAGDYTSARLNSLQQFKYGRLEVRAKLPTHQGNGLWPAVWMLGQNIDSAGWPACGEIDIMEYVSYDPGIVLSTIHSEANNHVAGTQVSSGPLPLPSAETDFHNYGFQWDSTALKFYIDHPDSTKFTFSRPTTATPANWPFDQPFYLLINMAVGGNWGGQKGVQDHIFPAQFDIDYVRVYQKN